jgi:signal transduction histidine kinase
VAIELSRADPAVVLSVRDDGPGIPAELSEQILDPLFTTKFAGTGLGLTIVQRVAEAHGAALEIRNLPGRGAMFSIRWAGEATES